MPRMLELNAWDGGYVYVNANQICAVKKMEREESASPTAINMTSGLDVHVKESVTDVVQMIANLQEAA